MWDGTAGPSCFCGVADGRRQTVYPIDIEDVKSEARRSYFGLDHLRSLEYSFQSSRPLFGYIRGVQTMMASATRFEDSTGGRVSDADETDEDDGSWFSPGGWILAPRWS